MTDTKKPTLSEIVAREKAAAEFTWYPNAMEAVFRSRTDIPYLLDLVSRMGKALEGLSDMHITFCDRCTIAVPQDGRPPIHEDGCPVPKARALLEELKK